jgi:hypothetical protein
MVGRAECRVCHVKERLGAVGILHILMHVMSNNLAMSIAVTSVNTFHSPCMPKHAEVALRHGWSWCAIDATEALTLKAGAA